ncbi:MAG: oligopeptidase B [Chloroflexi bacterium HGW-Chloroflexi-6]|nr:MAG: oligopeptidase B [Chloroflexi bacterium HGW-Chloroflexi-6]
MPSHPIAPKHPHTITQHGQTRVDNYFWLRERENPQTMEYLRAEDDYQQEMTGHTLALQETLFKEMKARIKEDDTSAPEKLDDYFYYSRTQAGQQYPIFCRKYRSLDAAEEILLDQNALAEGRSFCRLGAYQISPDHTKLAYSVDEDGSEKCVLYVKDLAENRLLSEKIINTSGDVYDHTGIAWASDNQTLYYVTLDPSLRPDKLYRHHLGQDPANDQLLYHEADEQFFLFVSKSRSQAYIMAFSYAYAAGEWRILPADQPDADFTLFQPRQRGMEYFIEHHGQHFFVRTNLEAQNFRLMKAPIHATGLENWQEIIPHRAETLLEDMQTFENHLVLYERRDGLRQIRISGADGLSQARNISFPEPVYTYYQSGNPEFDSRLLRFYYTSLVTPKSVIDFDMEKDAWQVVKQDEIPSGYDPTLFTCERQFATAEDGTRVPISLLYKKGLPRNGQNPALLYGYGSYGFSQEPAFNASRLSLVERGFVFAIAHIRGGSEMGRAWYENGKMLNKRNTFTDFIACAEHLIGEGYTSTPKLAIMGRSAGGLLVGAAMTMRPDLFGAVIAAVPFVDVVNTMSDPSIPLTTMEYDQWGNPDDREYFDYLMSYSPYDKLRATEYPDILISTGLNDPRVAYWEPAKFTAKLRELNTSDKLILLKTNFEAGHAGASGRYDYLKEVAFEYAFLIDRLADPNP